MMLWLKSDERAEGLNPRSIVSLTVSHQQPFIMRSFATTYIIHKIPASPQN